jgi:hypothetical protein
MALPAVPVGYTSWNAYIEAEAPALASAQGITLQEAKASIKLLEVAKPIRSEVGEPYFRQYNVFTTWANRALLPAQGRPWTTGVVTDNLAVSLDAGNTDSYPGTGTTWTNLVDDTDYTISNGAFDSGNGGSIVFNGTSTFVDIGTPLSNGTDFTKEAWVNADIVTAARNILSSESNVFWNNGSTLSGGVDDSYSLVTSASFPTLVWRHVVLTFDDAVNTMRLYINGVQVSQNTGVTLSYVSEIERIGAHFFGGNPVSFWDGKIAQVRVYEAALSAAQVQQNFDTDKARYGL